MLAMTTLKWRKSSKSTADSACVEVAGPWRKSSRCMGKECVEVAGPWRKSSKSLANDTNCVEVAESSDCVAIRDSKDPDGGELHVSVVAFRGLVQMAREYSL